MSFEQVHIIVVVVPMVMPVPHNDLPQQSAAVVSAPAKSRFSFLRLGKFGLETLRYSVALLPLLHFLG